MAGQAAPLVVVERLSKRFGGVAAVDEVSFEIGRGEFFALLGPSGCGKTTLMRMIAGFEQPDSGRIVIDGVDMAGAPPYRRPVNMMFQSYALFPHMSVAGNIGFGLKQAGAGRAQIDARVVELLRLVQLEGLGARMPAQLSGGQKQRVALARALARQPALLLLDEPLAALDRKLREETQFELMDVQRRLGLSFLVVTHDQDEAMAMAQRIAVMRAGRLEQIGDARAIYEAPASRFVAQFIGEVNLFDAVVERADNGWRARVGEQHLALRADALAGDAGGDVALAVRPERMIVARARPSCAMVWPGRIVEWAYRGDATLYRIRTDDGRILRVAVPATGDAPSLGRDEAVFVGFDGADARVVTR